MRLILCVMPFAAPLLYLLGTLVYYLFQMYRFYSRYGGWEGIGLVVSRWFRHCVSGFPDELEAQLTFSIMGAIFIATLMVVIPTLYLMTGKPTKTES